MMRPSAPISASPSAAQPPVRQVLWVLGVTLVLNLLSATLKLLVSVLSRNLTVFSDAMHGYVDAANNVMGIVAITVSWRPPDANHPYGHRKFEAMAALGIAALMTLTSWEIARAVLHRWLTHERRDLPINSAAFLLTVFFGLLINIFVSQYELRRGRRLGSTFLVADAMHTRSDILVTLVSLSSLLFAPAYPLADTVFSLVVIGFILHTGWAVLRDNVLLLTDAVQMDPVPIRQVCESIEGVINCHAIRSRGMPDAIQLDLHIVVPPEVTAAQTHDIEARVRAALYEAFPQIADVAIHHQTEMPVTARPFSRTPHASGGRFATEK